jgi:hypothetical protein
MESVMAQVDHLNLVEQHFTAAIHLEWIELAVHFTTNE